MTMAFLLPSTTPEIFVNKYIDLSQCASIICRRALRQGLNWAVESFTLITPDDITGQIDITSLQTTWCQFNAWQKAYSAWQKQTHAAMKDAGLQSTTAKYRDFKIYFDNAHHGGLNPGNFNSNLIPLDGEFLLEYQTGEWEPSQIVIPNDGGIAGNTVEYELIMHGSDAPDVKALIENYGDSRATPFSPDPHLAANPETTFYSEMIDLGEIQDEVVENATDTNQDLPYSQNNYPGGAANAPTGQYVSGLTTIAGQNIRRHLKMRGGQFPCGLIKLDHNLNSADADPGIILLVHLVPGTHRGYLATPMKEF